MLKSGRNAVKVLAEILDNRIWRQPVISPSLDVERRQIRSAPRCGTFEELGGENAVEEFVPASGVCSNEAAEKWVRSETAVVDTNYTAKNECLVSAHYWSHIVGLEAREIGSNQTVSHPVGGGPKLVGDAGIGVRIVSQIRTDEIVKHAGSHDGGKEFGVRNLLDLGAHDLPSFLVQALVRPGRVEGSQRGRNSVVLPHKNGMRGHQSRLLVQSSVSCHESGTSGI